MKKIFNWTLVAVLIFSTAIGCSTDPAFEGSSFFLEISGGDESGLPGQTVTLDVQAEATERIASIIANGESLTVDTGDITSTASFDFMIPSTASTGDVFEIDFILTDLSDNTDELELEVVVGP